jgi:leader peptidase (prepilin peptidase)/N-methyltransferase
VQANNRGVNILEAIGLICFYGLATWDDVRSKKVRVIEIIIFGIVGLIIDFSIRPYSFLSILGGVMVGLMVYLFSVLTKEKIGKGDALVVMVTGLYLGFQNTLLLVWLSTILAAVIGSIIIRKNNVNTDFEIPRVVL